MGPRIRRWIKIIGWFFVASAVACLVGSFVAYLHESAFVKSAARATGTVTKLVESHSSDSGTTFRPVYVFRDAKGTEHEIYSCVGSYPSAYKVGQKVTVLYRTERPDNASLDGFFDLWLLPFIFGIIGVGHLIIGLVFALLIPAVWKPKQPTDDPSSAHA